MEMTAPGVMSQAELTGAEITIRCLQEEGVEFVFGYPGGAILPIYDEMFKQDKVKHILVRHEQAAVHGALVYFSKHRETLFASGKPEPTKANDKNANHGS